MDLKSKIKKPTLTFLDFLTNLSKAVKYILNSIGVRTALDKGKITCKVNQPQ